MAKKTDSKKEQKLQAERRRHKRISKNFILTYFDKADPSQRYEITQLKNISRGGMCFVTTRQYAPQTTIGVELKTPYISDTTTLEGKVLESHEKARDVLYETRMQFTRFDAQAAFIIDKLGEFFEQGDTIKNA